jgi:hypothetical protein
VQARRLDAYMRTPGGLPSMINYPLYGSLGDVFARGHPTAELGYRIRDMMALHADPWRMPTFVDNHDVDRFLAGGSDAALRQALLAMLTLPGIPTLYYGTEQGFTAQRAAMFAHGNGSGGRDHFDTQAPLYRFLQRAIALPRPAASRTAWTIKAIRRWSSSIRRTRRRCSTTSGPGSPPARSCAKASTSTPLRRAVRRAPPASAGGGC